MYSIEKEDLRRIMRKMVIVWWCCCALMKEIAGKIYIINDIAFLTNILALNAAVEATRGGE